MAELKYFKIFFDYEEDIDELTDEEVGKVFRAALKFASNEELPDEIGRDLRFVFNRFKRDIERGQISYQDKCQKNSENIRKRWDKEKALPKDMTTYNRIQSNTKNTNVYELYQEQE